MITTLLVQKFWRIHIFAGGMALCEWMKVNCLTAIPKTDITLAYVESKITDADDMAISKQYIGLWIHTLRISRYNNVWVER